MVVTETKSDYIYRRKPAQPEKTWIGIIHVLDEKMYLQHWSLRTPETLFIKLQQSWVGWQRWWCNSEGGAAKEEWSRGALQQLLFFGPMAGRMVKRTKCVCGSGGGGGGVRGWGVIFEHCHSETWTPPPNPLCLFNIFFSLPPPSLPLFSPGILFPCVIRHLIKAVVVERMNAHSVSFSLSPKGLQAALLKA